MTDDSTLLRAVKTLNPVPLESAGETNELREEIRLRIASEPERVPAADVLPREIPRRTRRLLVGAAAATLVAAGLVTLTQQQPPTAYADWTPTPTSLSPADLASTAAMCPPAQIPVDGGTVDLEPLFAEHRGDYRMMLSVGDDYAYDWCFVTPTPEQDREYTSSSEGVIWGPAGLTPPEPGGIEVLSRTTWEPQPDEGPITLAIGLAGEDVSGVELSTANGSFAEATVVDGWWLAWFPGSVEFGDTITVTTEDGTEQSVVASADPRFDHDMPPIVAFPDPRFDHDMPPIVAFPDPRFDHR